MRIHETAPLDDVDELVVDRLFRGELVAPAGTDVTATRPVKHDAAGEGVVVFLCGQARESGDRCAAVRVLAVPQSSGRSSPR